MAEHGSCGLNASGSLTEKDIQCDIQWTSTASASLMPTDSGARDLLFELKHVLDASGIHELRERMAALQDSMMNMEMLVVAQASKMGEMASAMETLAKEPSTRAAKARTTSHLSLMVSSPPSPVSKPEPQQAPDRPSQDPIILPTAIPYAMPMGPTGPQNHPSKSSQGSRPHGAHASGDSESEKHPPKNLGSFYSRRSGKSPVSSFGLDAFHAKVKSPMLGIANLEDLQASQLLRSMGRSSRSSRRKNTGARQSSKQSEDPPRSSSARAVKTLENPQTDRADLLEPALQVEKRPSDSSLQLPDGKKKAYTMNSRLLGTCKDFFLGCVFDLR